MATIADVARLAGVATSTVSHVLNRTRFVSPATTRAVEAAVKATGYTPNTLARALARSSTSIVGLAMSSTRNRFFADVVNAIEAECAELGMMVLLANTNDIAERESAVVSALHQRRVDGIIIAPTCAANETALRYLREKRVPTVMVDRLPRGDLDGVGVENRRSLARMVAHLVRLGHRRIGFLAGQQAFTTARERREGYLDGLAAHGIQPDADLVSSDNTDLETARRNAGRILAGGRVGALIGANNLTTIGIMLALRDHGLSAPGDVAVAGFDDFDWSEAFQPRLTVMVQPCREIGRTAATLLRERMLEPGGAPRIVRLDPYFAIRESCGALGR